MENFLLWVFRFGLVALCAGQSTTEVRIDSKAAGLTYDGHGGLSAGASSRLFVIHSHLLAVTAAVVYKLQSCGHCTFVQTV